MKSTSHNRALLHPDGNAPGSYQALAVTLCIAGIIGSLASGCAYNKDSTASVASPSIQSIGLITKGADTAEAYYELGKYYYWQNRLAQAQVAFEHALQLRPGNVDIMNGLGSVSDRLGNYTTAQRFYREALAKDPQQAHIWANYGYSLLLEGRPSDAVGPLETAVSLDASNFQAQRNLALAKEDIKHKPAVAAETIKQESSSAQKPVQDATLSAHISPIIPDESKRPGYISVKEVHASAQQGIIQSIVTPAATKPATGNTAISQPVAVVQPSGYMPANAVIMTIASITPAHRQNMLKPVVHAVVTVPSQGTSSDTPKQSHPVAALAATAHPAAHRVPALGNARIEISNGNGITGMARGMRTTLSSQGVNVTRVTNAKPFNVVRTMIICPVNHQESANTIAMLLPVKPTIVVGSVAHRNVDVRVMLGTDVAVALNKSGKTVLAALTQ